MIAIVLTMLKMLPVGDGSAAPDGLPPPVPAGGQSVPDADGTAETRPMDAMA